LSKLDKDDGGKRVIDGECCHEEAQECFVPLCGSLTFCVGWFDDGIITVVFVDISLAALINNARLSVDGYSRSRDEVVATKDRVRDVREHHGCIAAAAGGLEEVVVNRTSVERIRLQRILAGSEDIVIHDLTLL
jgi:hypothetical protein